MALGEVSRSRFRDHARQSLARAALDVEPTLKKQQAYCLISDFPARAVTTHALHIGQQFHEKRIRAERGRVANQ